ncbi:MAG TPA: hypothetical protein VGB19_00855 [Actinomycetota bacterium]
MGGRSRGASARRLRAVGAGLVVLMLAIAGCRSARQAEAAHGPCPAGDPLRGVYHPDRLRVLGTCVTYRGVVRDFKHESDGDYHLYVIPALGMDHFLDPRSEGYGDLVVELLPGQALPLPQPGQRVTLVGTWAYDTDHDWNELHPVWAETIRGRIHTGLPPVPPEYGGSSNA